MLRNTEPKQEVKFATSLASFLFGGGGGGGGVGSLAGEETDRFRSTLMSGLEHEITQNH